MNAQTISFPSNFPDLDTYLAYTDKLRLEWKNSLPKYSPEDWIRIFPEAKYRVTELLMTSYEVLDFYKSVYTTTESLFSKNLSERIFEEALNEETMGKAIKSREKRIREYRRMLATGQPSVSKDKLSEEDIDRARNYPIEELLTEPPKRGFIHCPFHQEKTPSCRVFSDHIHCYGCGKHLNAIGYLMEKQGMNFIDSVKYLCKL